VRSSGRFASAGRIIAVGLVCFGLWVLLDANQLYHSAQNGGADGTRRNVSMAVLRPIAAISNALHLSNLVSWGESALNQGGAPGNNQSLPTPVITLPRRAPGTQLSDGLSYLPHGRYEKVARSTPPAFWLPPILQPTPQAPLTVLDIGDSIGEDLGFGLGDLFSGDSYVKVLQKGQVDTGLADPSYYNWPGHLEQYLQKYDPGAVVIMMGANDDRNLVANGRTVVPGTLAWAQAYTTRVDVLMEASIVAGAHVVWVGLPPMGGGNITNAFVTDVNEIFLTQARRFPGITYVPSWNLFASRKGKFEVYKKIDGSEVAVRSTDGLHLDPAGWDLLANALVQPMQSAWHVDLHTST
jgi:lysophospholipase L1-like esterase